MFKCLYKGIVCTGEFFQSFLLLAIRLVWGIGFIQAGYGKLMGIEGVVEFFSKLGIPLPTANAYLVGSVELLGGILLVLGLFARIASIPLFVVIAVAYYTVHFPVFNAFWSDPWPFFGDAPFNYLFATLLIFAFGPGKISLDYLLCKLFFQKKGCNGDRSCD